jgi:Flp pilus assembly protein TadD
MNSWHSFSPNGRWLVFSSKGRTPYTQMYLTHIDANGDSSPAILVENSTAANRAVNIPEFVNVEAGGLERIDVPAVEFYKRFDEAWAVARKGDYKAAIPLWEHALELDPTDARALNNLGFAQAETGRMDKAMASWRKALDASEDSAAVHKNLGHALLRLNQPAEAARHWRRAVEIDPEDAESHNRLGFALLRQEQYGEAAAELQRAVALRPNDAEARYNFGVALLRMGRASEAVPQLRKAIEGDPRNAQAHNDLAVALLKSGKREDAVAEFRRAAESDPASAQTRLNLGNALYLGGDYRQALAEWEAALRLEPDNPAALRQAAWLLATAPESDIRDGAEAVRLASRAVELAGGRDSGALDTLGAACAEAGRWDEALSAAKRALALADSASAAGIRARIAAYERRQPYRIGR